MVVRGRLVRLASGTKGLGKLLAKRLAESVRVVTDEAFVNRTSSLWPWSYLAFNGKN